MFFVLMKKFCDNLLPPFGCKIYRKEIMTRGLLSFDNLPREPVIIDNNVQKCTSPGNSLIEILKKNSYIHRLNVTII